MFIDPILAAKFIYCFIILFPMFRPEPGLIKNKFFLLNLNYSAEQKSF